MRTPLLLLALLLSFAACQKPTMNTFPVSNEIVGLTMPVSIKSDSTIRLISEDYFNDISKIDSVAASEGIAASVSKDKKTITLKVGGKAPYWGWLKVFLKGVPHAIPLKSFAKVGLDQAASQPRIVTMAAAGDSIVLSTENGVTNVMAFWENYLLDVVRRGPDLVIHIPATAKGMRRSTVRVYGYGANAPANDVLIPLDNGAVIMDTKALDRHDYEAQIMYFPFIDRFNNGNPANDKPVVDPNIGIKQNFQGGDLAGITAKIKDGYFKSMNINSLWLSPITQNPEGAYQEFVKPNRWYTGYHGYWPINSSTVDHRFGSNDDLKEMVKVAHENGINIILDFVSHHVHQEHPMFKAHPDWQTPLDLPDGRKNIRIWDGPTRTTTWFDTFMPTLDLSRPEVIEVQSDSALYWVKEFGLDGYRHDAAKHVPNVFWRTLTKKLKEKVILPENRKLYQIGETYGSDSLIYSFLGNGLMECQFDFNLFFTARDAFADKGSATVKNVAEAMMNTFSWYGHHSTMGYITGNHDQPRFMGYAGKSLKADEDDREAGWNREIGIDDLKGYDRLHEMLAFTLCIPGVPVIYYGDEIGMTGANDPDNRRMMRFAGWNEHEAKTKAITEKLTALRANNMVLIYGDTEILLSDDKFLAFARSYFGHAAIVVFNDSDAPAEVQVPIKSRLKGPFKAQFGNPVNMEGDVMKVSLPAYGFEVLVY